MIISALRRGKLPIISFSTFEAAPIKTALKVFGPADRTDRFNLKKMTRKSYQVAFNLISPPSKQFSVVLHLLSLNYLRNIGVFQEPQVDVPSFNKKLTLVV